jgi:hypothetical protein
MLASSVDPSFNFIAHGTDFRLGEDYQDEYETFTPVKPLFCGLSRAASLARGIRQEGLLIFSIPRMNTPASETPQILNVSDLTITLVDSFDRKHSVNMSPIDIPFGQAQQRHPGDRF